MLLTCLLWGNPPLPWNGPSRMGEVAAIPARLKLFPSVTLFIAPVWSTGLPRGANPPDRLEGLPFSIGEALGLLVYPPPGAGLCSWGI